MISIERNINGTLYKVTMQEEGSTTAKVVSLEVKLGQERGVLLQRRQQESGEGYQVNKVWIVKGYCDDIYVLLKANIIQNTNNVSHTIVRCASPRRDWVA